MRADKAEQGRVEAERGRVVAESGRVIAEGADVLGMEGSRREAEAGRVVAEAGRVRSETHRVHTEHARPTYRRVATLIALPLALVMLLPSVLGIGLLWNYVQENRELIERLDRQAEKILELREAGRRQFAQSDIALCTEIEALKTLQRQQALERFRNLDRDLELLNLVRTPPIVRAATENRDKVLQRFKARDGGCRGLPSVEDKRP